MKLAGFGDLKKTPIGTGFDLGKRMSKKKKKSISLQCWVIVQATPPPFLSHWKILYPGRFTSELGSVWSRFDSVIPIIAAFNF